MPAELAPLFRRWRERIAAGDGRLGWKVAINDPAFQQRLGLSASTLGYLTESRRIDAGRPCRLARGARVAIEPELAIALSRDVPGGAGRAACAAAIAGFGPALEVLDGNQPGSDLAALAAHDFFHAGALFADRPARAGSDAGDVAVTLRLGGEPVRRAGAAEALPDLAEIVALAADTLAAHGERLTAGDRILSGSMTALVRLHPGERVEADFGALGALALELSADAREVRLVPG